jgi:glutamate-ammonia-ligase adenylyltransferase
VTSARGFAAYHEREAAGWERVALLRARVIYSTETPERREALETMLNGISFDRPFDEPKFRAELRDMRSRIEKQRGKVPPGSRHVRFDQGGIMDVEFLVALGQLRHRDDPAVRTTVTADVLDRLVGLGWPATLRDDHAFLKRVALRLRLLHDRPQDVVSPRDLPPLARTFGLPPETLAAQIDAAMARVRATFDAEFGPHPAA